MTTATFGGLNAVELVLRTVASFVLILLPGLAACCFALRRGCRDARILGCIALAAIGCAGYLAFWFWFASPHAGRVFSFVTPLGCLGYVYITLRGMNTQTRAPLRPLLVPALLVLAISAMVLSAGFLYGTVRTPLDTPRIRFSHRLPGDNELPWLLTNQVRKGHILKPMIQNWLSSDRPPLQTGMTLLQFPFLASPRPLSYEVSGVVLQSFWIFGLWIFLDAFGCGRFAMALSMAAVTFTGFAFVNSFFIWPKLVSVAYVLSASAMLLASSLIEQVRRNWKTAALAGSLVAFAVLWHGVAVFSFLALAPALLFSRRSRIPLRAIPAIAAAFVALYVPWTLYQKLYDPPGDRLLKWQFAALTEPDKRSFPEAWRDAYRHLSWKDIIRIRKDDTVTILDDHRVFWGNSLKFLSALPQDLETGRRGAENFAHEIRGSQFFHFLTALGLLMTGPLFLAVGLRQFRSTTWRLAAFCWLYVLATLVVWDVLTYSQTGTAMHTGSYAAVVLAIVGSTLAITVISRRLAVICVLINSAFAWLVYVVYSHPANNDPNVHDIFDWANLMMLVLSCAATLALLRQLAAQTDAVAGKTAARDAADYRLARSS